MKFYFAKACKESTPGFNKMENFQLFQHLVVIKYNSFNHFDIQRNKTKNLQSYLHRVVIEYKKVSIILTFSCNKMQNFGHCF